MEERDPYDFGRSAGWDCLRGTGVRSRGTDGGSRGALPIWQRIADLAWRPDAEGR